MGIQDNLNSHKSRIRMNVRRFFALAIIFALVLGNQLLIMVPTARAQTNTLTLSVIAARSELKAPGGPVLKGDPVPEYKYLINVDNTGDPSQPYDAGCSPYLDPPDNTTLNPNYPDSCDWPSVREVPGAAPIFTQGDQD